MWLSLEFHYDLEIPNDMANKVIVDDKMTEIFHAWDAKETSKASVVLYLSTLYKHTVKNTYLLIYSPGNCCKPTRSQVCLVLEIHFNKSALNIHWKD